jgi:hypothetical protein
MLLLSYLIKMETSKKIIEGSKNFENEKANTILEMREILSQPDNECIILFVKKYDSKSMRRINISDYAMQMEIIMDLFKGLPGELKTIISSEILSHAIDNIGNDLDEDYNL